MPPEGKYYWLTEADRRLLDTLAEERRRTVRMPRYEAPETPLPAAPSTYVARTPEGGIPALTEVSGADSEDVPGYATCAIYQIIRDYPEATPRLRRIQDQEQIVYNVHLDPIGSNRWVPVVRDPFGRWLALAIFPHPSEDDPTGSPDYTGTGTGGVPPGGDVTPPWPPNPGSCSPVYVEETDLYCETAFVTLTPEYGTGTGTLSESILVAGTGEGEWEVAIPAAGAGTGPADVGEAVVVNAGGFTVTLTAIVGGWNILVEGAGLGSGDWSARISNIDTGGASITSVSVDTATFLNLYRRQVYLSLNMLTGCLERTAGPWIFTRTLGCCNYDCVEPNTGTGMAVSAECCADGESLRPEVSYSITGQTSVGCTTCTVAGDLTQTAPGEYEWNNDGATGGFCDGKVTASVTLYCVGEQWRARGFIRRFQIFVEDTTDTFDVELTPLPLDPDSLFGTISSQFCEDMSILVSSPCYDPETCLSCDPETIPAQLCATLDTPASPAYDGEQLVLTYDEGTERWCGFLDMSGEPLDVPSLWFAFYPSTSFPYICKYVLAVTDTGDNCETAQGTKYEAATEDCDTPLFVFENFGALNGTVTLSAVEDCAGGETGTGTGGGSTDPVQTDCCENPIPQSLWFTISEGCDLLETLDPIELEYFGLFGGYHMWDAQVSSGAVSFGIALTCEESGWRVRVDCDGPGGGAANIIDALSITPLSCDPFWINSGVANGSNHCCESAGTFSFEITE